MLAAGYDQVTERVWEPHTKLEEHTHPFEANAIVVQGEVILGIKGSEPRRLTVGDTLADFGGVTGVESSPRITAIDTVNKTITSR